MMPENCAVFVGGLNSITTTASVSKYFAQFGEISQVILRIDKLTGRNRGFGFIYYTEPESTKMVLSQEHTVDGHSLDCEISCKDLMGKAIVTRGTNMLETKLFIRNLPSSLGDEGLRGAFERYGPMKQCYIVCDPKTKISKCFGFVR